tara:strand:- start:1657 stop:2043 length:387 start_codon:yes stop_codon:yes gene_type:complete
MAGVYKFLSIHSLNNSVLSGIKAMPLKDSTSDNTSTFSRNRNNYMASFFTPTLQESQQKKWMNGNRDASYIAYKRKVNSIGNGSLNANNEPMTFTSSEETNSVRNALTRTRNAGSIVPPKKTHRMAHL